MCILYVIQYTDVLSLALFIICFYLGADRYPEFQAWGAHSYSLSAQSYTEPKFQNLVGPDPLLV